MAARTATRDAERAALDGLIDIDSVQGVDAIPRVTGATLDVLRVLLRASEPTWGLQVISATERSAGSVYPILARLEDRGWLTSVWEEGDRRGPRRRLYTLTDEARPAARALLTDRRTANGRLDWSIS